MKFSSRDIVEILTTVKELGFRRFHVRIGESTLEVDTEEGADGRLVPRMSDARSAASGRSAEPDSPSLSSAEPISAPEDGATSAVPRDGLVAVRAPMSGIFYRSPAPGAAPFVEVGSRVEPNDTVCIVEIMKLFNSIAAGTAGTVVEILIENEGRVVAGQPVMWIEPEESSG